MKFDKLVESIMESFEKSDVVKSVFGDYDRPASKGLKGIGKKIFDHIAYDPKTGAPRYNAQVIVKELKGLGLSDEQIQQIREKTIQAAKNAQEVILNKYANDFTNYHDKGTVKINLKVPDSFQVYQIYSLNPEWTPMIEFNKLFRSNLEQAL
jgi:hypothetical protein